MSDDTKSVMQAMADESNHDPRVWYTQAMEQLVGVVQDLSLARSVEAIQDIVRHAARHLTAADGATFVLRDGDRCYYADEYAIDPLWKGQRFPMKTCISGWVMLNRQSAVIEDIYVDPRIPHEAYRPTFVKSLAMVPIRTGDPIGAIGAYWARPYRPSEEEIRLLQALADTTAVAMENVTVHAELERRVRERTAEAMAARDEAQRANALKSRFLTAANHDLRQPLQSIGLYLSTLSTGDDSIDLRGTCEKARRSVDTMGELLDALLDLHRLESGSILPVVEDFPLRPLLERVVVDNRPQAESKGLRLELCASDLTVRSDPALLRRVLENLVGNALRYTPRGSVTVSCDCDGDHARIAVRDTGVGIPADALERVFDEYVQLDNPARDRRNGLGLGLSIVKHIAQALGHRIEVGSVPGEGSTFSVEVPACSPTMQARVPDTQLPGKAVGSEGIAVLFVEDDEAIADATLLLLRLAGFRVHHASDGAAAMSQVESGLRPQVIVSDYRLPRSSGPEVIARVREMLGIAVPAVLFTGDTSLQRRDLGLLEHCTVLHKPVDTDRLIALIEMLAAAPTELRETADVTRAA